MAAILPPWVREDGPAGTAERLKDPQVRARLRTDCDRYWRFIHRGEWHRVRLVSSTEFPEMIGKTFVEIGERWGKDPWDSFFDVLAAAGPRLDACGMVGRLFTEEHMAAMVRHPLFSLGVDGAALRRAYRLLSAPGLTPAEALQRLEAEGPPGPELRTVIDFVRSSRRGVILNRRRGASPDEDGAEA